MRQIFHHMLSVSAREDGKTAQQKTTPDFDDVFMISALDGTGIRQLKVNFWNFLHFVFFSNGIDSYAICLGSSSVG